MPFCELHAHRAGVALFAMYETASCERLERTVALTAATPILERERAQTGCFSLDGQHFCARNFQEKHLWMRALRNVKVKLLNDAPDPTAQELQHWRDAVMERIASIPQEEEAPWIPPAQRQSPRVGGSAAQQALTPPQPRMQPRAGHLQVPRPQASSEEAPRTPDINNCSESKEQRRASGEVSPPCCSGPEDQPVTLLGSFRRQLRQQQFDQQVKEVIAQQRHEDPMIMPGQNHCAKSEEG